MNERGLNFKWSFESWGHLYDGTLLMLVEITDSFYSRRVVKRKKSLSLRMTVILRPDGTLWRVKVGGRTFCIASNVPPCWKEAARTPRPDGKALQLHLPRWWGSYSQEPGGPDLVLPDWLLRGNSNLAPSVLARRALVWEGQKEKNRYGTLKHWPMRCAQVPESLPWLAPVVTLIPSTQVVVAAVHSGAMLQRLKTGMERIYVSEYCCILAPCIKSALFALAQRFPKRLVVVPAEDLGWVPHILGVTRPSAVEYQFGGYQLRDRVEDDWGFDKFDNPSAMRNTTSLCVGPVPRGVKMIFGFGHEITLAQWSALTWATIDVLEAQFNMRKKLREARAMDALFGPKKKPEIEETQQLVCE